MVLHDAPIAGTVMGEATRYPGTLQLTEVVDRRVLDGKDGVARSDIVGLRIGLKTGKR